LSYKAIRGDLGFFNMKRDQRKKKVLLQDMSIFLKFLKLFFDRICIPPPKKRLEYIGLLLSVRGTIRATSSLLKGEELK
jgi:hypothetical protein